MKQFLNTQETAEFYIESGKMDRTDISSLVNSTAKELVAKIGKDEAMKICMPFMKNKDAIYTKEGLKEYLDAIGIESISQTDPITGRFEYQAYITFKN